MVTGVKALCIAVAVLISGVVASAETIKLGLIEPLSASGSHNAHAISDAVTKHNARDPERSIIHLNFGSIDTALTNEKCSFWHFRFDANVDMKLAAMTSHMAGRKDLRRVYLINQDYAYGQTVARVAKDLLGIKRRGYDPHG